MLQCPFLADTPDQREIWEMLIRRDSEAFVAQDWAAIEDDFIADGFFGVDAGKVRDASRWTVRFARLEDYRREWLRQAAETAESAEPKELLAALSRAAVLERIDFNGDCATVHKVFDGALPLRGGGMATLKWRSIYVCRRDRDRWRIASFVGYLPHDLRTAGARFVAARNQHRTAGPYSPAMGIVGGANIIVLSGQAPLNDAGEIVGDTIEEQARVTLENCRARLEEAGCSLADVFKASVYMTDLSLWARFNTVYAAFMPAPYPARTALETGLLPGMLVEIEMWAARR
jgi:reactive intermediate/imine deaminase